MPLKLSVLMRVTKKKEKLTPNFRKIDKTSLLICDILRFIVKRNVTESKNSNVARGY